MIVFFSPAHIRGSKCAPTHTNKSLGRAAGRCGGEIISGTCGLMRAIIQPHTHRSCATRTVTVMGFFFFPRAGVTEEVHFLRPLGNTYPLISCLPRRLMTSHTSDALSLKGTSSISETVTTHACTHAYSHTHTHVIPRKTS